MEPNSSFISQFTFRLLRVFSNLISCHTFVSVYFFCSGNLFFLAIWLLLHTKLPFCFKLVNFAHKCLPSKNLSILFMLYNYQSYFLSFLRLLFYPRNIIIKSNGLIVSTTPHMATPFFLRMIKDGISLQN